MQQNQPFSHSCPSWMRLVQCVLFLFDGLDDVDAPGAPRGI